MAVSLRGQLGTKSSPLSPTSSKLSTQMLVISHMDNHYKKIGKAKPAIDNAPPKSMVSSQKLRDRQVRKYVERHGSRPTSRSTHRPESAQDMYDDQQWEDPANEDEHLVRDIMRTTLRVPLKAGGSGMDSVDAVAGSRSDSNAAFGATTLRPKSARMHTVMQAMHQLGGRTRPASARSTTSIASNFSQTSRNTSPLKVTYAGDVLNKHAHSFTEPSKPFTPRTLKSNRESSLKRYKYYTPPPGRKSQNTDERAEVDEDAASVKRVPRAKPRQQRKTSQGGGGGGDLGATETLTETMLMDMSLQSHDPRQRGDGGRVPRLDISMDKDHLSWMQEQATRAQIRVRNGAGSHRGSQDSGAGDGAMERTGGTLGHTDTLRFTRTSSTAKLLGIKSPTSHRLNQAEEEQKYVRFAHEVTQDIVSRGISSDRVLHKVFENHIDRKKGELDERRLRAIITDIRRDLGVQNVDNPPEEEKKSVQYSQDQDLTHTAHSSMHHQDQGQESTMDTLDTTSSFSSSAINNTYNFGRTTDMLSTIHSQREEEEGGEDDLSTTGALKEYTNTLKAQVEEEEEDDSQGLGETLTAGKMGGTLGSTLVNGDVESESDSQHVRAAVDEEYRPSPRPRQRQNVGATQQQADVSRQASVTDTDAKTEIDEEEDYEDDYDADDDDNQDKVSEDDF